jgi:hypothetical protein
MGSRLGGQFLLIVTATDGASHLWFDRSSPIGTDFRQLDSSTGHQSGCHGCSIVERPPKSRQEKFRRAGKCVVLSKSSNTTCTILPVATAAIFRRYGRRFWSRLDRFDRLQSCIVIPFVVGYTHAVVQVKPAPASRTATCDLMWDRSTVSVTTHRMNTTWQGICNSPLTLPFECRSAGMRRGRRMFQYTHTYTKLHYTK